MAKFIVDNWPLLLFLTVACSFSAGFCVCALLVMARRSSNDYEGK